LVSQCGATGWASGIAIASIDAVASMLLVASVRAAAERHFTELFALLDRTIGG
jgi:hypothetical protein